MSFITDLPHFISECLRQIFEPLFYNSGIHLYAGVVRLAGLKNKKAALMIAGHKESWRKIENEIDKSARYVWIHAASLGEFEQGRPLIEMIKRERRDLKIILTFFSPSGYEVRKNYAGADVVAYLPFDTRRNVRRFLYAVNPEIAVFVKYEFWRNYLNELNRRAIPTYLISAIFRKNQLFFKSYGGWYRRLLHRFSHIFVQEDESIRLLRTVGYERTTAAGDTRFDRVTDIMRTATSDTSDIQRFVADAKLTIIVGSSWEADEEVYIPWVNRNPEVKIIVAPHEFDANRLEKLRNRFSNGAVLYSDLKKKNCDADITAQCLIIDCFGLLSQIYRYGSVAYIGGGFGAGIHNINEAAVYGMPVIFGPKYHKFLEAKELIALKGGFAIKSIEEYESLMNRFAGDNEYLAECGKTAKQYIESKLGATEKIFKHLFASDN